MSEAADPAVAAAASVAAAEAASVEVGQRGFSEPVGVTTIPDNAPQRPEWCPEQFFKDGKVDNEGMAKSYGELRTKMSQPKDEPAAPAVAGDAPKAAPDGKLAAPVAPEAGAATPLTTAMDAARNEWATTQAVTDETVASLEAAGIPKEVFALYLEGIQAVTAKTLSTIHSFVDGEDNYNAMATWAGEKLSANELEAFNTALDTPDMRENAVKGLYSRYTTARPSEGTLLTPAGTPSQTGDTYASREQLTADQRNPLYQTSGEFRKSVEEKLTRSHAAGFQLVKRPMFEREILTR